MTLSALIFGATGQTGRHLLTSLLSNPTFTTVTEAGRRSASSAGLVPDSAGGKEKLKEVKLDFATEGEAEGKKAALQGGDLVFITFGTTRANAGSAEAFEKIDRGYPVSFAKLAFTPGKSQKVLYVSSTSASPTSSMLYSRCKGLTEQDLASIGYEETIIFRPGVLTQTRRDESRIMESAAAKVLTLISQVSDSVAMPVPLLGSAMVKAGTLGYTGLEKAGIGRKEVIGKDGPGAWVLGNADCLKLAKLEV